MKGDASLQVKIFKIFRSKNNCKPASNLSLNFHWGRGCNPYMQRMKIHSHMKRCNYNTTTITMQTHLHQKQSQISCCCLSNPSQGYK